MRLIDADRALEIVRDQGLAHPNAYHLTNYATLILQEAPTVEAEPVHYATWELVEYQCTPTDTDQTLVCTHCGFAHQNDAWFNRCPNCGAKMDKENEA